LTDDSIRGDNAAEQPNSAHVRTSGKYLGSNPPCTLREWGSGKS